MAISGARTGGPLPMTKGFGRRMPSTVTDKSGPDVTCAAIGTAASQRKRVSVALLLRQRQTRLAVLQRRDATGEADGLLAAGVVGGGARRGSAARRDRRATQPQRTSALSAAATQGPRTPQRRDTVQPVASIWRARQPALQECAPRRLAEHSGRVRSHRAPAVRSSHRAQSLSRRRLHSLCHALWSGVRL
jgi:hypothetical protein